MGDFVDRGFYSVETFLLLLALKVQFSNGMLFVFYTNHLHQSLAIWKFINTIKCGEFYIILCNDKLMNLKYHPEKSSDHYVEVYGNYN